MGRRRSSAGIFMKGRKRRGAGGGAGGWSVWSAGGNCDTERRWAGVQGSRTAVGCLAGPGLIKLRHLVVQRSRAAIEAGLVQSAKATERLMRPVSVSRL